MGNLKPWQLGLVIVAVLVLAVSLWMNLGGSNVPRPGAVLVADVETGELFSIDTSGRKIALLPATNPDTGERTLFPVRKEEDGSWVITPIGRGTFTEYEGPAAAVPNRASAVVNLTSENSRSIG
jgi:hypothetical protein